MTNRNAYSTKKPHCNRYSYGNYSGNTRLVIDLTIFNMIIGQSDAIFIIFATNQHVNLLILIMGRSVMKKVKTTYNHKEEYELDNIYNENDDRYGMASNSSIWYN